MLRPCTPDALDCALDASMIPRDARAVWSTLIKWRRERCNTTRLHAGLLQIATMPIDTVKVRLQLQGTSQSQTVKYK